MGVKDTFREEDLRLLLEVSRDRVHQAFIKLDGVWRNQWVVRYVGANHPAIRTKTIAKMMSWGWIRKGPLDQFGRLTAEVTERGEEVLRDTTWKQ